MKKKFLILAIILLSTARAGLPQGPRAFTKDTRYLHFHSDVMKQERKVLVMLPAEYDASPQTRYPVLYMHDGQRVFVDWRIDELMEPLFAANQMQPIIVVAIFNGDSQEERFSDYTPTHDSKFAKSGNADLYGRMIVEELKAIMDSEFRTAPEPANTAIGGTSLGGLVSLYLALKYPNIFGKVAVMSPSVWWDKQMILREVKKLNSKPAQKIWLDIGTKEGDQAIAATKALRDALLAKGWRRDLDLKYFEANGAEHDEKSFARRAPEMLKYLFPPVAKSPAPAK
jgi:predicted alpha/beta superfamily hydrolase